MILIRVLLTGLILCGSVMSAIINVPGDQPTIQFGIDAAGNGDTVLVAPGLYVEVLVFGPRDLVLMSSGGPAVTTLMLIGTDVIEINGGSGHVGEIHGFTITGLWTRAAVKVRPQTGAVISGNIFIDSDRGDPEASPYWFIHLQSCDSSTIENNAFLNKLWFPSLWVDNDTAVIRSNLFHDGYRAISLSEALFVSIERNIFSQNRLGIYGLHTADSVASLCNIFWNDSTQEETATLGPDDVAADPLLCDSALWSDGIFHVDSISPASPLNNSCGVLIGPVAIGCDECYDPDGDLVCIAEDNCPSVANADQIDGDGDGVGDACDQCVGYDDLADFDLDGVADSCDNCPTIANKNQVDTDMDGIGNECDECTDSDGDGFGDPGFALNTCPDDNCPYVFNPDQADSDGDGFGDACPQGDFTLDNLLGAIGIDSVACGVPVRFELRFDNTSGYNVDVMTVGFRIYSPDGAQWLAPIGEWNPSVNWEVFFSPYWVDRNTQHGANADTIGFGAFAVPTSLYYPPDSSHIFFEITTRFNCADSGISVCLDSSAIPPQSIWSTGTSGVEGIFYPSWPGPYCFTISGNCCRGMRGNLDNDIEDQITVSDLTYLVDFMFGGGPGFTCEEESNINGDGGFPPIIDDLTYLVDYMFVGGPAPPSCP